MYTPKHFSDLDETASYAFMMAHPFGLAVTVESGVPVISHAPFLVNAASRRIRWHLAAANPHCELLAQTREATLVFLGPHAYVSPRWYTQPNVPTWNYVAVHVRGAVHALDATGTAATVADLSRQYEEIDGLGAYEETPAYRNLLNGIRGFELSVEYLVAKRKLSQNRIPADQAGVSEQLLQSPDSAAREVGELMRENLRIKG